MDALSRDQFEKTSIMVARNLFGFGNPGREYNEWMVCLALYGPSVDRVVGLAEARILRAIGTGSGVPWKGSPGKFLSGATAHGCASSFMDLMYQIVFKEHPDFKALGADVAPWIESNHESLVEAIELLGRQVDWAAMGHLDSELKRERILTLNEWGDSNARDADNHGAKAEPLTDEQQRVFDYIKENPGNTSKQLVNALDLSSESALTTHFIPELKKRGVKNRRGFGYYVDS